MPKSLTVLVIGHRERIWNALKNAELGVMYRPPLPRQHGQETLQHRVDYGRTGESTTGVGASWWQMFGNG